MIKGVLRTKLTSMVDVYHFKLLLESSPFLSDGNSFEFLVEVLRGKHALPQIESAGDKPLDGFDKAMAELIVDMEECYPFSVVDKRYTVADADLDCIEMGDLLPHMGVDVDHLIKVYLKN